MDTPPRSRVLVATADEQNRESMVRALHGDGHDVRGIATSAEAYRHLERGEYDLVVLDLDLDGEGADDFDGFDVLTRLREASSVPVLVISAREGVGDRVLALDMGADDYVVKPVLSVEVRARARAILRRSVRRSCRVTFGPLEIDEEARSVTLDGEPVHLTRKEFDLLAALASEPGRVFRRDELLRDVWGSAPEYQDPSTITEHVRRLRHKLGDRPDRPRWIAAVRGVGYRFEGYEERGVSR